MRLTDLLGLEVAAADGRRLGKVHDALLVQDGPLTSGTDASFRLRALAVVAGPSARGSATAKATWNVPAS